MSELDRLAKIYMKFRIIGRELEEFIADNTPITENITEEDTHRLDKCSVVLKMAFKDIKRQLRKHGLIQLKATAHEKFVLELKEKPLEEKQNERHKNYRA